MHLPKRNGRSRTWARTLSILAAAIGTTSVLSGPVRAQVTFASAGNVAEVTYAKDVASIVQNNCLVCHRPGGIGPMDLATYEDARRYARRIREQVANRLMPPYYYDNDIGIQDLEHDWRLSQEDIDKVVAWVDQGAPLGNPADMPPPPDLSDTDEWVFAPEFGQPDVIVRSSPIDVPANGLDMWHRPIVPVGITTDRCIRAIQVKPAGDAKGVVHHANSTFQRQLDDGGFEGTGDRASEYAMGKLGELIPDGVCRVAPANSYIAWDIHLFPGGLGAAAANAVLPGNVVEMGLWLHPENYEYKYKQDLASYDIDEGELVMKPHGTAMSQGFQVFDHPVRIDSFQPHGHLRLRSASLEILYPETNRIEVISMISNWSAIWHQSHIYAADAAPLLPAGAVLIMKQWYDNSANNPNVADPEMWVDAGSRTADEMDHAWIAVTHLDEEGYQELLEQRRANQERRITDQ
ncbi:MAG: cytochrome c [Gemmatimonadetes bacterium]|nr:cytochrome c [Gemmatimonadota bacterium]